METISEKAEFPGASGALLAARLERPSGKPRAYALFAHCFTCSKDVFAAKRISQGLAEKGIAVLRFDFTGLGNSEGDFANTNFSSNVGDLVAAAEWLSGNHGGPDFLIGHSLGGAAVLAAAAHLPDVKAVATIGAPSDPGHVEHLVSSASEAIERDGEAEVTLAGRSFRITRQFLEDIRGQSLKEELGRMRKAILVCHAPFDDTVSIDNASEIFVAAKHPKSFLSLDDADHLLSRRSDAAYVAEVLSAWATRYIGTEEAAAAAGGPPISPDGAWVVFEEGSGKFLQHATDGRLDLIADEPPSFGGDGKGPTPYDFLSIGLGACTSMTIRMYADRKKWPVARVAVRVAQSKIHAQDCADCETREGKVDRFEREIRIEGTLDADQRARLLEIADKCPVHRTLHRRNDIVTRLIEE